MHEENTTPPASPEVPPEAPIPFEVGPSLAPEVPAAPPAGETAAYGRFETEDGIKVARVYQPNEVVPGAPEQLTYVGQRGQHEYFHALDRDWPEGDDTSLDRVLAHLQADGRKVVGWERWYTLAPADGNARPDTQMRRVGHWSIKVMARRPARPIALNRN